MSDNISENPPARQTRRTFLKLAGAAGVTAASAVVSANVGPVVGAVIEAYGNAFDVKNKLPDNLLKSVKVSGTEEAEKKWGKIYQVLPGDTINAIAESHYKGFEENPLFYIDRIRYANQQDKAKNVSIYPGQELYIPDPRTPALGFAAGEFAILEGKPMKDGTYWQTIVQKIDQEAQRVEVAFYTMPVSSIPLEVGEELTTDRRLKVAAILKGGPSPNVPPRVVFELID